MNTIKRNKGALHSLLFDTLDRKPISDIEARNNYRDILFDYCSFLHRLSAIELSSTLNLKLKKQYDFVSKLDTLAQRYKSIGTECIADKNVEAFLNNVQNHMRDWIDADYLETDLKAEETKWFSAVANEKSPQTTPGLERKKSEAVDVLMQANRNRVNFGI